MQSLQTRKINGEENDNILGIISDKFSRSILKATLERPKSALEISRDTNVPICTVYRRLQNLYDNKLVRISGEISDEGKKFFLYKSKVRAIHATFDYDTLEIEVVPNTSGMEIKHAD